MPVLSIKIAMVVMTEGLHELLMESEHEHIVYLDTFFHAYLFSTLTWFNEQYTCMGKITFYVGLMIFFMRLL